MEVNAFRSFKMVLGMSGGGSTSSTGNDTQDTASISNKPRTDSSSSSASHRSSSSHSSRSSRSGHSRSRRHRSSAEELNLPLDRAFVAVPHEEEDHAAGGGEAVDADRVRDQVREEVVCMIFDLPRSTTFYQDFSCALAAAFPMHGRMYPTGTHVCFYSNVFGSERKILIPYESIAEMVKTTTLMFQGAIRIKTTTGEDYTFTSFWGSNRETCFDLIAKVRDRVLGNSVDSRDQSERSSSRSESQEDQVDQDNDADNHRMLQRTVSDGGIVTAPRDISMTLLVEEVFNVSVDTFLTTFVLDGASFGFEEYNKRIGTTEMQCNPWSTPEDDSTLGRTRELQFRVPIDSPIGPKSSRVDILQCYKVAANDVRIIESSTRLVDIPYGDYFSVEDRWTLVPHPRAPNTCTLTIELKVVFSKSTFWRSQIESRALSDNKAKWIAWVGMAKEHLAQGNGTLTRANAPAIESPPPPPVKHTETPRRPTGVVDVDPRGDSAATRSQSYSSGRTRRRRRRAIAVVIPWFIIVVLIAILFKLHATIQRMEHLMAATEQRIIQIQSELAQVQPRLEANAVCSGELGR